MSENTVIIGAGQAGLTVAVGLREHGYVGGIHLIGAESRLPYQRPPLSKGYLSGVENDDELLLRSQEALDRDGISLHLGVGVMRVDREQRTVTLTGGAELGYDKLVFATGSRPRKLSLAGADLEGIHAVRTVEDCDALRADLGAGGNTVFIGGGFLNLEVAVEAAKHGAVTVLEAAPQILGRVLSREAAGVLLEYHRELGIDVRCGVEIESLVGVDGRVNGVRLANGEVVAAQRIVVSIGAVACDEIAADAGFETAGGIVVDASLRTEDPDVFAIGDCAKYFNAYAGIAMRVESVQNATDQARSVSETIAGNNVAAARPYSAVPWFWSTQGDCRLQIAGIAMPNDESRVVLRDGRKLTVERLRNGNIVAVETINAPGAHMKARRALAEFVAARAANQGAATSPAAAMV